MHVVTRERPSSGDVHVWWARIETPAALPAVLAESLSLDERRRAQRLRSEDRRQSFVAARGILRDIISGYTGERAAALRFSYGPHDKPMLDGDFGRELSFNVAHAGGLAVYAIAGSRAVGIDLERVHDAPEPRLLAGTVLTESERAALTSAPEGERETLFLRFWTLKEAYLKATGRGLTRSLQRVEVSADATVQSLVDSAGTRYSLHVLDAPRGYVAALAAEGPSPRITSHWWEARTSGETTT